MSLHQSWAIVALLTLPQPTAFPQDAAPAKDSEVPAYKASGEKPPPPPIERQVNAPYGGAVTAITKDSITIQWLNSPGEKPRTFALTETLAAGEIPKKNPFLPNQFVDPIDMYRLTDVKVGDLVVVGYARFNGTDICHNICIRKRPGGRIPPLPEEAEKLRWPESKFSAARLARMTPELREFLRGSRPIPYHEYWNAYWDLEDKGIPFPEKFGKDRRFPVAPPPRRVLERQPVQ